MKMKKILWLLAIVLLLLLPACSMVGSTEGDKPVVRYVNFKVYDPVYVAIEKGFFEDHGIEVKIVGDVIAGPNAIQAVSGGSAEAGLSSIPAIINANAAGLPIQGVVDIQTTLEGQALQKWYTLKGSEIGQFEDIEGSTYAVNIWRSSFHYTSLRAMDAWGVDDSKVDFQLLSFADQIPALIEEQVDVIGLIPPYQGYLEQEYGDQVEVLWNDFDLYGKNHVSLIFINRVWAKYNQESAEAFVLGISDAIDWIEGNQKEATQIVSDYTGIPAEAVGEYHFTEHGQVHTEDVADWLAYLRERGDITEDWLEVDEIATNKYLESKLDQ